MSDRRKQYEFSDRLNSARKGSGLKYKDISQMTGIPYGTISNYMRGIHFPGPDRLKALAYAVGVSVDDLFGATEGRGPATD